MVLSLVKKVEKSAPNASSLDVNDPSKFSILLSCPICSIPFLSTPLVLSCGHTFCEGCVGGVTERLKNKSQFPFHCPSCSEECKRVVKNYALQPAVEKQNKLIKDGIISSDPLDEQQRQIRDLFKRSEELGKEVTEWDRRIDLLKKHVIDLNTNTPERSVLLCFTVIALIILIIVTLVYGPSFWTSAYATVTRVHASVAGADFGASSYASGAVDVEIPA